MNPEIELKKHLLNYDESYNFFVDNLKDINALSNAVLKHISLTKGSFYTFLPNDVDYNRIYDFYAGEIIPQEPYETKIYKIGGDDYVGVEVKSIDENVAYFIYHFFAKNKGFAAIFDSFNESPTSPHLGLENTLLLFMDEEIYYLVDACNTQNEILNAIRTSNVLWHSLGVVFENTSTLQDNLTTKDFETICKNLKYSMVMAYDSEGFVFWEPLQDTYEN